MEFLMDNPKTEQLFQKIIRSIPSMQNGLTAESMKERGVRYEKNWGVSLVDLKAFSASLGKDHLLALKLWNKKWRETMILATMVDDPKAVTEEQMDFWSRSTENTELIEQMVINLFVHTPFAFAKSIEWCRGRKYTVKYAGLMMMGRLALTSKNAIDEMFEPYFDVLPTLAKDKALFTPLFRSICQLARRSPSLLTRCTSLADELTKAENESALVLGNELLDEFNDGNYPPLSDEPAGA
jgi:3-methyladenine DNA glycosylase AlkD